jgi:hypothetical protein
VWKKQQLRGDFGERAPAGHRKALLLARNETAAAAGLLLSQAVSGWAAIAILGQILYWAEEDK